MSTATAYKPNTLAHVPPGELLLERNIRPNQVSDDLVRSIRDVGVLQPITAVINAEGQLVVRLGHRRTLAAVEAGVGAVPVYVVGVDSLADDAEVDRIIRQHDENVRRDDLTAADEVSVVEQLAAFGLTAAQISKRGRIDRKVVDTATTVSGSPLARKAAEKYEALTLDQAATVAEFDDDPETAKALIVAAIDSPGRFAHIAQQQRDDRTERQAVAVVRADLESTGVTVIEKPSWDSKIKRLVYLKVSAGGAKLTKVNHAKCPGHVAWVDFTGWAKDNRTKEYGPDYGCNNPAKYGHFNTTGGSGSARPPADELSPEEREEARAARRLVIDNNKAWTSATTVRREWLAEFAGAKAAPKGAAAFIAFGMATNAQALLDYQGAGLAAQWLGVAKTDTTNGRAAADLASKAGTETRALHIALVMLLADYEAQLTTNAWRENGKHSNAGHYLRFLQSCGFTLSDVEDYAISSRTA